MEKQIRFILCMGFFFIFRIASSFGQCDDCYSPTLTVSVNGIMATTNPIILNCNDIPYEIIFEVPDTNLCEYKWYRDNANIGNDNSLTVSFNGYGQIGDYFINANCNCDGMSCSFNSEIITISMNPIVSNLPLINNNGTQITCSQDVTLSPSQNNNYDFLYWINPQGQQFDNPTTLILTSDSLGGEYIAIFGNTNDSCLYSKTIEITKQTTDPIADASATPPPNNCITFTLNGSLSEPAQGVVEDLQYRWYQGNLSSPLGPWSSDPITTLPYNIFESGSYYLIVSGEDSGCTNIDSIQLNEDNLPIPEIEIPQQVGFPCDTTITNLNVCDNNQILEYFWETSNGTILTGNDTLCNPQIASTGTYELTIQNQEECTNTYEIEVFQPVLNPNILPEETIEICEGNFVELEVENTNYPIEWSTGDVTFDIVLFPTDSIQIFVTEYVEDLECYASDSILILVNPKPIIEVPEDIQLENGAQYQIEVGYDPSLIPNINWSIIESENVDLNQLTTSGDQNNLPGLETYILFENSETGYVLYQFNIKSGAGCEGDTEIFRADIADKPFIPKAFSPNGDGFNDEWIVSIPGGLGNFSLQVFDRRGVLVHESADMLTPWTGAGCPPATYYYIIESKGGTEQYKGVVVIVGAQE